MSDRTIANRAAAASALERTSPDARSLLVLSTRSTSPGQRFRIENWMPILEDAGIHSTTLAFMTPKLEAMVNQSGDPLRKVWRGSIAAAGYPLRLPSPGDYDGLLVYRAAVPAGVPFAERWLARSSTPMALDIDDPIFFGTPGSPNPFSRIAGNRKWKRLCAAARLTICINDRIAEYLAPYSQEVVVLPNLIDLRRYPEKTWAEGPIPVVGYHGSPSTVGQLREIAEPLERVASRTRFELRVVGGRSPVRARGYQLDERSWSPTEEVDLLHGFDVGLAPAAPDEWSRFKSFVKILVYMAVGVPVVATAVGSAPEVIEDGSNGFLASTREDWIEKIGALVSDFELRERMGHAARRTIEREYSLDAWSDEIVSLFSRLVQTPRLGNGERPDR
jgi:glycosyltransferase involved in cell wall biosynthesis